VIRIDSGLISVSEAAEMCNYTPQAIRKAIAENRLDAIRIGKTYALELRDVSDYAYDKSKEIHHAKNKLL